jgi:hypothetical protein
MQRPIHLARPASHRGLRPVKTPGWTGGGGALVRDGPAGTARNFGTTPRSQMARGAQRRVGGPCRSVDAERSPHRGTDQSRRWVCKPPSRPSAARVQVVRIPRSVTRGEASNASASLGPTASAASAASGSRSGHVAPPPHVPPARRPHPTGRRRSEISGGARRVRLGESGPHPFQAFIPEAGACGGRWRPGWIWLCILQGTPGDAMPRDSARATEPHPSTTPRHHPHAEGCESV